MSSPEHAQPPEVPGRSSTEMGPELAEFVRQCEAINLQLSILDNHIVELRRDMLDRFDGVYRRLDRLDQECQASTQAVRRIEAGRAGRAGPP